MDPDNLKCPVCMEIFDGKVFILKCGHNLCWTCLPKVVENFSRQGSHKKGEIVNAFGGYLNL